MGPVGGAAESERFTTEGTEKKDEGTENFGVEAVAVAVAAARRADRLGVET